MRHLTLAAAALAFAAVTAAPAHAQVVIYNSNVPSAPGFHIINTPPFYNGLSFSNGMITAFPAPPRYDYYPFGYPGYRPYYGYPAYPGPYPYVPGPNPGYGSAPGTWRP